MDFEIGDFVRYHFPDSTNPEHRWFEGNIDFITDEQIRIKSGTIIVKVSFKNFENIELVGAGKIYEE